MQFLTLTLVSLALLPASALCAPAPPKPDHSVMFHRRAQASRRSVDDVLDDVEKSRVKVWQAMQNYKANFGSYPAGANTTALDAIGQRVAAGTTKRKRSMAEWRKAKRATPAGSAALTDEDNSEFWVGPTYFGSPAQGPFLLDFDTGSSDTFAASPTAYNPAMSSAAVNTGKTFTDSYADGSSASGEVYTDTYTVGGLAVLNQALGAATTSTLSNAPAVGLSGMAFKSISQFGANPFFYNMVEQGLVSSDVFAFGLQKTNGVLDLGGVDSSRYTGSISYVSVDSSKGFWETSGEINGVSFNPAIIDTGTSVIIGPPVQIAVVCLEAGGLPVPDGLSGEILCEVSGTPKAVTVTFGAGTYTIDAANIVYETDSGTSILGLIGDAEIGLEDGTIFGDTFLSSVYAVFEGVTGSTPQVGFANLA